MTEITQSRSSLSFVKFQVAGIRVLQYAATWRRSKIIVQGIIFLTVALWREKSCN